MQRPIYYVSQVPHDAEICYPPLEKFAYAHILSARQLRLYFQTHQVTVLTNQPLCQVLSKPDVSGRLAKWAIELKEFGILYEPRWAIQAQALTEFLVEGAGIDHPAGRVAIGSEDRPRTLRPWKIYVDGSSNRSGSGAGLVIQGPGGYTTVYALRIHFMTTNNEAEYKALITSMKVAKMLEVSRIRIYRNSQLVVNQVEGGFQAHETQMVKYRAVAREMAKGYTDFKIGAYPVRKICSPTCYSNWMGQIRPSPVRET